MSSFRRWGISAFVLCLPVLAYASAATRAADEGPAASDAKAEDALVYKTLREVINEGADMYNAQGRYKNMDRDYAGCYHFYEGALMMARPLLNRHADLQKAVDDAVTTARDTPKMEERAFVLRAVIDRVREAVNPKSSGTATTPPVVQAPTVKEPPPVKETTTTGKIVNGEKGKLIVLVDGKSRTFAVPDTAQVLINDKEGKLEDLDFSRAATVTITSKGDLVTKVAAHVEAKVPTPAPPEKETTTTGKVISAEGADLALRNAAGKETKVTVPATAKVFIDDKEGKLADVKADSMVTVTSKGEMVVKIDAKAPASSPPLPAAKTLWDRLGGETNVAKVVDDFVNTAGKDPKVNFWRDPTKVPSKEEIAGLKKALVEFVSSATGGPLKYEGKSMKDAHRGMKISNEEFDAAAKDLREALEKHGAKADDLEAVMTAVGGTRKDIVESKEPEDKTKPEDKKTEDKKDEKNKDEKGDLSGKVTLKGDPIKGGEITVTDGDRYMVGTKIGDDGSFALKNLKVGQFTVVIQGDGVPKKFGSAKTSAMTLEIQKGEHTHNIDLQD